MPRRPRSDDDEAWIDEQPWGIGCAQQLTEKTYEEGQARPRNYDGSGNMGFVVDPAQYRKARKRKGRPK